jgi:GxxExxY protein
MSLRMSSTQFSPLEERIAQSVVDSAYAVHSKLGPGLLESVYEVCFCHELSRHELASADSL